MKNNYTFSINKICFLAILLFSFLSHGQVTTNSGSGLAASYPTLADAITAVNAATITSPVIITLTGNETAPAGGYQITAQGTATNTITIQGTASTITASNTHVIGSVTDAVFKLIGADYITLQNFTIQENSLNTVITNASNTKTEFGIGLFYETISNGSQNNTIQNNTISLDRLYQNSFGIYSNVRHTFTNGTTTTDPNSTDGSNSNNKFYSNNISNVNNGITLIGSGSLAFMDINNEIGGNTTALGNIITNWGSDIASTASLVSNIANVQGIYVNHQKGYNISNNTITSASSINTNFFRGIIQLYTVRQPSGIFTNTISNNQITLNCVNATTLQHISVASGVLSANLNITNNILLNSVVSGVSTTINGVVNNSIFGTININNNTIKGWTSAATSGGFVGFSNTAGGFNTLNCNNNKIGEDTTPAITFSAATVSSIFGISNLTASTTGAVNILNNDIRGIVQNTLGTGTNTHNYIQNNSTVLNLTISDNTFTNITANTNANVTFINHNYAIPTSGTQVFNNNKIVGTFIKNGLSGNIICFNLTINTNSVGTRTTYTNNDFSNITSSGNNPITGINCTISSGTGSTTRIVTGNKFDNWSSNLSGGVAIRAININQLGINSTISNNTISNLTAPGQVLGVFIGNFSGTANPLNINNNIISKLTSTNFSLLGIYCNNQSSVVNINDNVISELKSLGTFAISASVQSPNTYNIGRNKITTIEGIDVNSGVEGINVFTNSANSNVNIGNNYIGNLFNPLASRTTDAIIGINLATFSLSTNYNIYNNTINFNATSSGTNFSTCAIYATTNATSTTSKLDLKNNIFINNSVANGTGTSVAYRRSNVELANFDTTSNNNNFVAPILFADGTNFDTTIEAYKARVAPRETNSMSEMVNFLSTNPADATYLHINPAIATPLESNAIALPSITSDFDLNIRQGQAGYTGTGTAPDIGADEFEGTTCSVKPAITVTTIYYVQNAVATQLTATGTNLLWYTTATNGTGNTMAPTPQTTSVGTTSYYVSQNTTGCESARVKIDVIIALPATHLNFNATTDYVDIVGIATTIDPINTFTAEAWVYPTAISNGLGNDYGMIVGNYNTNINDMQFMLRKEPGNSYVFWVNDGSGYKSVGAGSSSILNSWQHIAGVWNGSDIKIYINGVLGATNTDVIGANFASVNNPVRMGLNNSNEKFVGNIDEVRLWSRALTQAEIMNNMNCELPSGQTNLLAYYKFNQGIDGINNETVNTITDFSGNNYNGTLNGFALKGNTSNWLAGSTITSGTTCSPYLANNSFNIENFSYYPNPVTDVFHVKYNKNITSIQILDVTGRILKTINPNVEIVEINLGELSSALYILKLQSEDKEQVEIKVFKN